MRLTKKEQPKPTQPKEQPKTQQQKKQSKPKKPTQKKEIDHNLIVEPTKKKNDGVLILRKNMTTMVVLFVLMFVSLIGYTTYSMAIYGKKWFASPYNTRTIHQKNRITVGNIYDTNGLVMADVDNEGNRTYPQSTMARYANAHILGDEHGITSGGAQSLYSSYLYGFNLDMMDRIFQAFQAEKNVGNSIVLTVDSDLNKFIYEKMGKNTGAVVVMNYKTGEILASVSKDSFDISNAKEIANKQEEGSYFVNKATSGKYPPGSTFKIITAICALENIPNAMDIEYDSPSFITINGEKITNYDSKAHGVINLATAIEVSSNTYFAQLAKQLGGSALTKTAQKFGFNKEFMFDDVLMLQSNYSSGKTDNELAWSSVGQFENLITPLHMTMITSAIANDGVMVVPKTLKDVTNSLDRSIYKLKTENYKTVTTTQNAQLMQDMMVSVVESGTGTNAKINGYTIGGKTGSAETSNQTHAWFTGYIESETTPYAISVILEGAGTGGSKAAPLAKQIFSRILE